MTRMDDRGMTSYAILLEKLAEGMTSWDDIKMTFLTSHNPLLSEKNQIVA